MRLTKITLKNYRSFKEQQTLHIDGAISILIGPNGGGKSNLLDITLMLLRKHVFPSWFVGDPMPHAGSLLPYLQLNDLDLNPHLQKHRDAGGENQSADITVEVTDQDVNAILTIIADESRLSDALARKYIGVSFPNTENWKAAMPLVGQKVTVAIRSGSTEPQSDAGAATFLEYLNNFEWIARLWSELDTSALPTPILSLPANRSAHGLSFDIGLAGWQERDYKKQADVFSSRMPANITQLAIGRLAARFLELLHTGQANPMERFLATDEAQGLTRSLEALGYKWSLRCTNQFMNTFTVDLTKGTRTFSVNDASSGEKEILVYLFAIFGLNVRQAVVIVDEPELHLHPRLQKKLYQLFEELSKTTGNQFILATHSTVFVSPSSIQYVSRVYNEEGESKVIRLNDAGLPNAKHLFNIVNSQNNEALFFADHVLLVEGLSDKIFFEKILELRLTESNHRGTIEVVPVGGKGLFSAYEKILNACKVPYSVVADQDYLEQIGSYAVKAMLALDTTGIKKHVIDDPTSRDGATLVTHIEQAIQSESWEHAQNTWAYIKSRRMRVQPTLTDEQKKRLEEFIEEKRAEGIYILSLGALEAYLPPGHLSKDIEKLISLLESEDFWPSLPENGRNELSLLIEHLMTR